MDRGKGCLRSTYKADGAPLGVFISPIRDANSSFEVFAILSACSSFFFPSLANKKSQVEQVITERHLTIDEKLVQT